VTRGGWLGAAAVAILVWVSSAELPIAARLWTAALLAGLPLLMIAQARQLEAAGPLPRTAAYISSIISLWILAAVTAGSAAAAGYSPAALGLRTFAPMPLIGWSVLLTAIGLLIVLLFHRLGFRETEVTRQLVPASPQERMWFVGVSATAGICEEFVFRGFLILALHTATGSMLLAVLLSSTVFGVVHAYQQPVGAFRAAILGAVLALPVVLYGTLWPGILAHVLIDLIAGLYLARYLMR
jgi:uncharacterized protein